MTRSSSLALLGGPPVVSDQWPSSNTIGEEEKRAVEEVLSSGVLSGFRAGPGSGFLGGPRVMALEAAWADYFGLKHAVSFNSLTSGLQAAIGAIGIVPGDEVIVPPLTMSASVTCVLAYGGVPVFADIDPVSYCLDPKAIEAKITSRTRAIVIVHLFGCPADMEQIMKLAQRYDLKVIEDCAQAPLARCQGQLVGAIGHLGGFSLNCHKTIQSGEGGIVVTNDDELALGLQLIRNHGEVAVEEFGATRFAHRFGGNYRMTEIEAAIATAQLEKLERLTAVRVELAAILDRKLSSIPGLTPQRSRSRQAQHVYYMYALNYDEQVCGLPRELFVQAVRAEGIELRTDYARPVYWEPLFRQRGLCPEAEAVYTQRLIFGNFCRWPLTAAHMDQVVHAFQKVLAHQAELLALAV